jgi:hypothetical protein
LSGAAAPPDWQLGETATFEGDADPVVRERYRTVRDMVASRP